MTEKGKRILKNMSSKSSELLGQRIVAAMEERKGFTKYQIVRDTLDAITPLDIAPYSESEVRYGVEAAINTFLTCGMLVQQDKHYYLAKQGERI